MLASARAELASLLPHSGRMLLLQHVRYWDEDTVECTAVSHRDLHNPLRRDGQLPGICGLEYAAQAMAVHCGLLADAQGKPSRGYLGSVRDVSVHAARLDDIEEPLIIIARRRLTESQAAIYAFEIMACEQIQLTGSASVFLNGQGRL